MVRQRTTGRRGRGKLALGSKIRLLHPGGQLAGMDPCDNNVCDVCEMATKIKGGRRRITRSRMKIS